ncbi:AAA family ATPase [Chakrabartyella piscis]|uniref:AAA family ATPase n=1 Tax=Chakrabartyella piscis TaxID=2918914 RepID=UPI0029585A10|nr:AAA family ATPase [Chakrabartyella piscis]
MEDVEVREVEWLWYPYIPYGKITIIQGDPGEGKTTAVLQLSALLSKGEKLPCDDRDIEPVNIIYQTAEDGLNDTVKPRLVAANADCTKIKVIDETDKSLTMIDEHIEEAILETGARVVILDPIQAYLGAEVNMNSANEIRDVTKQLGHLADRYNCAIILIGHMNKGGGKASYRGLGSIDFQAVARSVLIVGRLKDNPTMRIIAQGKSSLAPEGDSIAFELNKDTGFRWIGKCEMSVEELLSGTPKDNKSQLAERLLNEMLEDGKRLQSDILAKAKDWDISKRVLDEAKKKLGVKSTKTANKWYWELPPKE